MHVATICVPEFVALWRDSVARGMEVSRIEASMIRSFVIYLEHALSLIDVGVTEFFQSAAMVAAESICSKYIELIPEADREGFREGLRSIIEGSLSATAKNACVLIEHELRREAIREFQERVLVVAPSTN